MGAGLLGLNVAQQSMSVPNKRALAVGYATVLSPGITSWTAPASGRYKFYGWSGGGGGDGSSNGGASGSYFEVTKYLQRDQAVACAVGRGEWVARDAEETELTFSDGQVVTAGPPSAWNVPGVATGGDVNLNGSPGGEAVVSGAGAAGLGSGGGAGGLGSASVGGGGGAPANLPMRGAPGGQSAGLAGGSPGGGARGDDGGGGKPPGGSGLLIVVRLR